MIDADDIEEPEVVGEPLHPPAVPRRPQDVPVVDGIAPELPRLAEVIGRNARDETRFLRGIELEDAAVAPYVRAVVAHVDRNVAEEPHARAVATRFERHPLPEKEKLDERLPFDLDGVLGARLAERLFPAVPQILRPPVPDGPAETALEHDEERVIVEPVRVDRSEALVLGAQPARRPESVEGAGEEPLLLRRGRVVIAARAGLHRRRQVVGPEQAVLHEPLGTYEERVPGEGRDAAVGRVAVGAVGRVEGQHLPDALFRAREEIGEFEGSRAEIADGMRRRKGGDVQQNAGAPFHGRRLYGGGIRGTRKKCRKRERAGSCSAGRAVARGVRGPSGRLSGRDSSCFPTSTARLPPPRTSLRRRR